ncbi:MAG: hypothetical protein H6641_01970 [Caldilineaceae bacterium]|nr:hypothetical protein [Caldilineaceae bacterium]
MSKLASDGPIGRPARNSPQHNFDRRFGQARSIASNSRRLIFPASLPSKRTPGRQLFNFMARNLVQHHDLMQHGAARPSPAHYAAPSAPRADRRQRANQV